jgi:hypothetical protein
MLMTTMDNIWTEYQARYEEMMSAETFSVFCAILRQVHMEFRKVRQHGSAVIQQGSKTQRIGATWWYVLQTHCEMDELLEIGFKQHPAVIPVFKSYLDRQWVSKTTFATLETLVKRIKYDMAVIQTTVNRLNCARGNPSHRANAPAGEYPP